MTRAVVARERRRREGQDAPLPAALRAELRSRVQEAAARRERIVAEAKRQRRGVEQDAAATFERIRAQAQSAFEAERAAIQEEIDRRAADG